MFIIPAVLEILLWIVLWTVTQISAQKAEMKTKSSIFIRKSVNCRKSFNGNYVVGKSRLLTHTYSIYKRKHVTFYISLISIFTKISPKKIFSNRIIFVRILIEIYFRYADNFSEKFINRYNTIRDLLGSIQYDVSFSLHLYLTKLKPLGFLNTHTRVYLVFPILYTGKSKFSYRYLCPTLS